ncbi:MAG TPA: MFS transporter, partial [Verrucomicrobiae bacterium]
MSTSATPRSNTLLLITLVAATGGFLFGYDTAVINGANQYLKAHFSLTPTQEGIAGASAILGCIPGAMLAGFLSDRFGRRKVLFLCAILYAVSGLLSAIPRTFGEFLAARFVSGLGIGASSMICPIYIAELAPAGKRGRLGSLFQLGIVVGIFLTLFINAQIQGQGDEAWNAARGWRWMLGAEVVPAALLLALLFFVPESPRWLIQAGREVEARDILNGVAGPEQAEKEITAVKSVLGQEAGRFRELFHARFRAPLIVAVALMAISQFSGINAIMYYS